MAALIVIFTGIITGSLISILYYWKLTKTEKYEQEEKMENGYIENTVDENQIPKSWDGESNLIQCRECNCLNQKQYNICRICTSKLYNVNTIDKSDLPDNIDSH